MMRNLAVLLAAASAAFAQADPNVITVTASRQLNAQPDRVTLTVQVASDFTRTLDNVLAFLQGTRIAASDLSTVSTVVADFGQTNGPNPELVWTFTPTVSFSDLTGELAALGGLAANGSINLTYFSLNATTSPQALAAQACPYPALINDAQIQAGKLAAAAGVTVGPIVSVAQGGALQPAVYPYEWFSGVLSGYAGFLTAIPSAVQTIYDPAGSSITSILESSRTPPTSSSCALTIQFKLGQ